MKEEQKIKEKTCTFYASDYHFEMICLPYINKNLEQEKEVIVLTQNNLEETINKVISRINLKEDKRNKILKIDWKDNNLNKIKKVEEISKNEKDAIILIKGKQNYIKNTNENIEKWTNKNKKIKLIDCYDISEISEDLNDIMNGYEKVLTTTGERNIIKK